MQSLIDKLLSQQIRLFLRRFCFLLGLYSLLRLAHLSYNWSDYKIFSSSEIFVSLFHGIRFDIAALCWINFIPFLFCFLGKKLYHHPLTQKIELIFFCTLNLPFILANAIDIELTNFAGKRITSELFLLSQDVLTQTKDALIDYWGLDLFFLFLCYILYKVLPRHKIELSVQKSKKHLAGSFIVFLAMILGSRGGLQYKPLQALHAYIFADPKLALLSLNSSFTIIKSLSKDSYQKTEYYSTQELITKIEEKSFRQPETEIRKLNVFIIIMESFSLEYTGASGETSYTPFLDQLAKESVFLKNSFANARRSIEAVPSVICGIPKMMNDAFITSQYNNNQIQCLSHILKQHNYNSGFFHGAKNGTMYFDSFSSRAGFDNYFGLSQYPEKNDFDGAWGIFDHHFFNYTVNTIDTWQKPFLATLFSLSSHHPYKVPSKLEFPSGTLDIHQSIGYSDWALEQMINQAKNKTWFKDTLFVITADHTSKSSIKKFSDILGRYRIPILFYFGDPSLNRKYKKLINPERVSQQVDILPTILDILGIPNSYPMSRFGSSWLSDKQNGFAIFGNDAYSVFVSPDKVEHFISGKKAKLYDAKHSWILSESEVDLDSPLLNEVKLYRQYYFNHMIEDSWLLPPPTN